jgi:hypothetical protein
MKSAEHRADTSDYKAAIERMHGGSAQDLDV